jgi:hypothetical protein
MQGDMKPTGVYLDPQIDTSMAFGGLVQPTSFILAFQHSRAF